MNDLTRWQQGNREYLVAAVRWLRLLLVHLAEVSTAASPTPEERSLQREQAPATDPVPQAELDQEAQAVAAAEASEPPPALMILARRFALSRFEQEVLLLCAAMELDTGIAALCARAQDAPNRPYPTFALAMALFDEPTWDALSPEQPLRYWQLIMVNQRDTEPLIIAPLRADERVANYVKGLNHMDDRLAPLLAPLEIDRGGEDLPPLPPSQQAAADTIVRHIGQAPATGRSPVIQLLGADGPSKQWIAGHVASRLSFLLYRLPAQLLPAEAAELEMLARLWQRETHLLPVALYLDALELERTPESEKQAALIDRFLRRSNSLVFLDIRDIRPDLDQATITLDMAKPTPAEQRAAWVEALGPDAGDSPALLAAQFDLGLTTIQQIARTAWAETPEDASPGHQALWDACLDGTRPQLDILAQRIDAKATWEDIVLPEESMQLLTWIAGQVGQRSRVYGDWGFRNKMNRGLGINALFVGESGTGKTMAAEVIANHLRLNLYRIDLSAVVSKYIGETEKNLRRLFDAAEDGGAILFFDEADALFGKRSEVKDSHDRYANIEINYLLQRMEAYRGLAILATNMKSALDDAFLRRLRFIVPFPYPGQAERKRIWQKSFPPETPTEVLDFDHLARLKLTGGSIHNVALNSAFLAAQAGTPVTMALILAAARAEFRKLEQTLPERDLNWVEADSSSTHG